MKKMGIVAQANSKLNEKGGFAEPIVMGRHRGNNQEFPIRSPTTWTYLQNK